jgi:hypothetical protein
LTTPWAWIRSFSFPGLECTGHNSQTPALDYFSP